MLEVGTVEWTLTATTLIFSVLVAGSSRRGRRLAWQGREFFQSALDFSVHQRASTAFER
jgi:hypothetical protein